MGWESGAACSPEGLQSHAWEFRVLKKVGTEGLDLG